MAKNNKDKTLIDNNRLPLNLIRPEIEKVLPDYYPQEYPNLITLFEKYYEWMDSDGNPNDRIRQLYNSRDATQMPSELLEYIEDELLLGNSYFGGFQNKREAVKFSNTLYRSKGTKYAFEQFFRTFFGTDPTIEYTKERIFNVGPQIDYALATNNDAGDQVKREASIIGPESGKYITDNKLYQQLALLIRTDQPIDVWEGVYKLFVHPAGFYVGSETLIVSQNTPLQFIQVEAGEPIPTSVEVVASASMGISAFEQSSFLYDSDGSTYRLSTISQASLFQEYTVEEIGSGYRTFNDAFDIQSHTMDDSATDPSAAIRDYATMSDSSLDSEGMILRLSFDQHSYDTEYDV